MTQKSQFVFGKMETIKGSGENADYQHFLFFSQCFPKRPPTVVKLRYVWYGINVTWFTNHS